MVPEVVTPLLGFANPVASWLHITGAACALVATPALCRMGTTAGARAALASFGIGAAFALTMSGAYHASAADSAVRAVFQRLDHAAIWVLIAATFTPVHAILFRGPARWAMLLFVWSCAAAGVVLKTVFFAGFPEWLGLVLYLALGWVGGMSAALVARSCGWRAPRLLIAGGLLYSLGGAVSLMNVPAFLPGYLGSHELFHVAVLVALFLHWRFIDLIASGGQPSRLRSEAAMSRPVESMSQ